jgi:c-di-GMP-binding flagellar brake protein YcgR
MMDERRIKPRWQINQSAELTFENGVRPVSCVVEDISQSGMRVSLRKNLFDDVFSNFKLALPQDLELEIGAQVAWRQEKFERHIYGLAFNQIDKSASENLDRYINDNFHGLIVKHWWEGSLNA